MAKKTNILLVAITRLGDMLQMSPTITGLKRQHPNSRITVVIDRQFAQICSGIPEIDEVYVLDLSFVVRCLHREQEGVVEAYRYLTEALEDLRERKFDYCLNMSNSSYTALLIKMLNVPDNRGWLADDEGFRIMADPWAMLFAAFVYHSNRDYNSLNLVDIFRCAAEVSDHPRSLQYRVSSDSINFAKRFIAESGLGEDGPLICLQAGASQEKRQWSPRRFARVVELLVNDLGARVIYTGAPSEQKIIDQIMEGFSHPRAVSAVGKTNFDQLAGLLNQADLMVTGDTGPMHLSVAVGTPVVALFLASALCFETGPYSEGNFVLQPQISCNPCNPNYPCARPDCHTQITPELVAYLSALRLKTPMGEEHTIRIPSSVADPSQVIVYYSSFDEDGFLDFLPLNGTGSRFGQPKGYLENARDAYRALWKEEFAGLPLRRTQQPEQAFEEIHPSLGGIERAEGLCREGSETLRRLISLVEDSAGPPSMLKECNEKLRKIDHELEEVSLAYPIIGAIIRIFIMEKENLRGDDPVQLITETKRLYENLLRRSRRFGQLYSHYHHQRESVQSNLEELSVG